MTTAQLKATLKRGPRLSREARAEYLLWMVDGAPRRLSPGTIEKLRLELARLATSPDPRVRGFIEVMRGRYPEVRE